ncbi:MAG: hypothetical protein HYY06_03255 [Deltaproteobacteria bacterium]|nr:hypothetical protein [Deltaproteobacteria bacterium]
MEAWGRHCGHQPDQEILGLKDESAGAISPDAFERELEAAIGTELEALLSDGRPGDVLAEPLDLSSVAAVDDLLRVHVDASHFGDGLIGVVSDRAWGGRSV